MNFICNSGTCDYQVLAEVDMAQHMKVEHSAAHGTTLPLVCSATLVEKKSSGDGYVECPVLVKRTGSLEILSSSYGKSRVNLGATTVSKPKTSRRRVSSSDDDTDDDDDSDSDSDDDADDSDANKPASRGGNAKSAKRLKTQTEAPARQTRNSQKAKTNKTTTKTARIDDEAETDEEVQSTTVTSSNDHTSATTTTATTVTADQVDASNEETGEEVAETTGQVAADETETGETADETEAGETADETETAETVDEMPSEIAETADEILSETANEMPSEAERPPSPAAEDSVCNSTELQPVDKVSETTAMDGDQLPEATEPVAADERETGGIASSESNQSVTEAEETATEAEETATAEDDADYDSSAAPSLLTQEFSASD